MEESHEPRSGKNRLKQRTRLNRVKENEEKQSKSEKKTKQSKPEKLTKQIISVNREKQSVVEHQDISYITVTEKQNLTEKRQSQNYQRRQSEILKVLEKSSCGILRRSEMDASSERLDSDDELRYKIESFIARQRRNQNDE